MTPATASRAATTGPYAPSSRAPSLRCPRRPRRRTARAGIYLGIHWAFDKTAGIAQGLQVADYVLANALMPTPSPNRTREEVCGEVQETVRVTMPAAANDPGAASGVLVK
jgi:hypothetical protein